MWRTIVLGKLFVSTLASFVVAVICFQIAGHEKHTAMDATRWYCLSGFFAILGVSFIGVVYLLFKRGKHDGRAGTEGGSRK